MTKTLLIAAALIAGIGFAVAQDQVPGNKSEAATPAAACAAERAAGQGRARPFELAQCRPSGRQGGSQCARAEDEFRGREEIAGVRGSDRRPGHDAPASVTHGAQG